MKTNPKLSIPILALFLLSGCGAMPVGSDPVVVDAEKATTIFLETTNTFLKLEYDNQALVKSKLPQVHAFANTLRVNAPKWIQTARDLTKAYKQNRTPENKASLQTALAVLNQALNSANTYIGKINNLT